MLFKMKKWVLFLFLLFLATSCGRPGAVDSINSQTESMREDPFEFEYPIDWKISGKEDIVGPGQKKAVYYFTHPQNKKCRITIETRQLNDTSDKQLTAMIAVRARELKDDYSRDGYGNFSFKTLPSTLSGKPATSLITTGTKNDVTRKVVTIILFSKGGFYSVSYQWFDNWSPAIRSRLREIVSTFRVS